MSWDDGQRQKRRANAVNGLGIIFMLGGAIAAYVKRLQSRVNDQEKALGEFKLYVVGHYASQEFLNDLKREITDSLRDLGRSRRRQRFSAISSAFGLKIAAMAKISNRNTCAPQPVAIFTLRVSAAAKASALSGSSHALP